MERKDLFINNDLSVMLSRELASAQESKPSVNPVLQGSS